MFISSIFFIAFCVGYSMSLETCRELIVGGLGPPDGVYVAESDYRGRPDFFRDDQLYNLYGEISQDGTTYWQIDNALSRFPYHYTEDDSYHPIDIETTWYLFQDDLDPVEEFPTFTCVSNPKNTNSTRVIIISCISILSVIILVILHVVIRKRRLKKVSEDCPICKKRTTEVNRLVSAVTV